LWVLPDERLTAALAAKLERNFYARCPPKQMASAPGKQSDSDQESASTAHDKLAKSASKDDEVSGKHDSSMLKALHTTFFNRYWWTGILYLIGGKSL
jgi:ATP-binding cassette, subfamily C (CFTR/MRP), member 1